MFSGQHEAFALRFGNGVAKFPRRINPKLDGLIRVRKSRFRTITVRHAPRQFRDLRDKDLVFFAPINDDFVLVHI